MTKYYRDENLKKALASNAPKWLKQVFNTVCQELDSAESKINEIYGKEKTNVYAIRMGEPQFLPKHSRIGFTVNGNEISVMVRQEHDGESLEIHGQGSLFINPQASNACNIRSQR
ncbi:MAG: hypothetical protein KAS32_27320 [Candidatus Peribacteraceae bacterium]|nr:hypothetical protein [Candidatus Peribacteraceae bacterium]